MDGEQFLNPPPGSHSYRLTRSSSSQQPFPTAAQVQTLPEAPHPLAPLSFLDPDICHMFSGEQGGDQEPAWL